MKDLSDSAVKLAYKVSSFKKLSCHCFVKVFEVVLGDWKKIWGVGCFGVQSTFLAVRWPCGIHRKSGSNMNGFFGHNYLAKLLQNYYLWQALGQTFDRQWCQFAPIQELQSLISSIILIWKISNISSWKCKNFLGVLIF